jgi:hypothetical protein
VIRFETHFLGIDAFIDMTLMCFRNSGKCQQGIEWRDFSCNENEVVAIQESQTSLHKSKRVKPRRHMINTTRLALTVHRDNASGRRTTEASFCHFSPSLFANQWHTDVVTVIVTITRTKANPIHPDIP